MGSALVYVVVVGAVAAVIYLATAFLAGRGEELAPMPPGATPTRLPARDLTGTDVRELRFQQTLRGYRMGEVDWALDRLAAEVDALRARLEVYEGADRSPSRARTPHAPPPDAPTAVGAVVPERRGDPTPTDPGARLTSGGRKGPEHGNP